MPINPMISLGIQQPQLQMPDPNAGMNALAKALQLKSLSDEQNLRAQSIADTKALNEAYRGAYGADGQVDRNKLMGDLAGRGLGSRIPSIQKSFLEVDDKTADIKKKEADRLKTELETIIKKSEHVSSVLHTARDQQSYDLARQTLAQQFGPQAIAAMPPQFDPMRLQAQIAQGQTITQRLAAEHQRLTQEETGRHNVATERNAAGQLAVSQGQLGVARGNLNLRGQELEHSRNQPRGQFIETTEGYVLADPKSGATRPVMGPNGQPLKGKAADRQLTDSQAKANLFGSRMKESDRILSELEGKYSPMAVNAKMGAEKLPLVGGLTGYAGNKMLSTEGQQAEQAQRDFINAVLRRESGAVISEPEFANGQKQYFPQPGDDQATLDQKRRNRALAIRGMEAEVPGGFRGGPSLTNPGSAGGASGGWSIQKVN